ncbi:MAG: cell division protein ZapD [Gammaproteobacteria bacterium]
MHTDCPPGGATVVYEQPLNERVRAFLRLEHLFRALWDRVEGVSESDSRASMSAIINVTDLLWRSDIKGDLIKEIKRQAATFARLRSNPWVDSERLNGSLVRLEGVLKQIKDPSHQPGQAVRQDELVGAVRQRIAIQGGTCSFDLPAFHYWLNRAPEDRVRDLERWVVDLRAMRDGIFAVLQAVRDCSDLARLVAAGGFHQQSLDAGAPCQLIRIHLPSEALLFPEISAGRHRFTVRFLEQPKTTARPTQTARDVEFGLQYCLL